MKFQSPVYTAVSGSIGGITYGHNKGGMYARGRGTPTNETSVRQTATRAAFSLFAGKWTTALDQAQRDLWNTYAQNHTTEGPFGEEIYINGICWYIMFNSRLLDAGEALIEMPPSGAKPGGFISFDADISAITTVDITFNGPLQPGEVMQLWMTLPGTAGQTPNFKQARLIGYSAQAQTTPWAATMPFGVNVDNQSTFYARRMNSDGQVGPMTVDSDLADYGP